MAIGNFVGAAQRQTAAGLAKAVADVGCSERALLAVVQVESARRGFDHLNRPVMLFEPHIFYRELENLPAARARAVAQGLAYPRWGERPYPVDSYPRIIAAMQLDAEAALRSASWGLPQILGSNFRLAGYGDVFAMVEAFMASEDNQLAGMASFIVKTGLAPALKALDWARFARGYNGAAYARNGYDRHLAAAYAANRTAVARNEAEAAKAKEDQSKAVGNAGKAIVVGTILAWLHTSIEIPAPQLLAAIGLIGLFAVWALSEAVRANNRAAAFAAHPAPEHHSAAPVSMPVEKLPSPPPADAIPEWEFLPTLGKWVMTWTPPEPKPAGPPPSELSGISGQLEELIGLSGEISTRLKALGVH